MQALSGVITFLFTDIEGSSRLWEHDPDRMRAALASHDAIVRAAVENNHGEVVKMSGDGYLIFGNEKIPFTEAQPSPDGAFWRCKRPDGTRRCFFAPPPAT